jgi:hypothetical protein
LDSPSMSAIIAPIFISREDILGSICCMSLNIQNRLYKSSLLEDLRIAEATSSLRIMPNETPTT